MQRSSILKIESFDFFLRDYIREKSLSTCMMTNEAEVPSTNGWPLVLTREIWRMT